MYDVLALIPASLGRRQAPRLRLALSMNEYVKDEPCQALARDVSEGGLALQKRAVQPGRPVELVTLEIELPGTNETIWAAAEPRFDALQRTLQVSGLRFVSMARKHERLIRDYVRERRERLARLLTPRPMTSRFV
ncbi:MAG TPA: PilZ domain-containing protein [Polyangia bacterium]|nr:PilZ domain-containing protein [Polyangia bacterium]